MFLGRSQQAWIAAAAFVALGMICGTPVADAQTADGDGAKHSAESGIEHGITNGVSILLPTAWQEFDPGGVGPPDALAPYAPPFHLGGVLALENKRLPGILQFATSTNPLAGHDPNWLDTQMHMPGGSGMSVLDLLFYFFFPPDGACVNQVLGTNGGASFAPAPGSTSSSAPPQLQVSYHCRHDSTLEGFFSAQVSSGITFVQTNDGPRVYGMMSQFYLAPMERVTSAGITWYVFEALRTSPVGPGAATHFNLPSYLQGEEADFFWAIGAAGSFPWVNDAAHANQPLIHVAFATVGVGGSKRAEFLALLQKVEAGGGSGAATQ
ncbi:MAG: hypothetical protein WAL95_14825 [Candidatus Acidiferrales bacterium]